jgi:hypothetical protein
MRLAESTEPPMSLASSSTTKTTARRPLPCADRQVRVTRNSAAALRSGVQADELGALPSGHLEELSMVFDNASRLVREFE